MTSPVTARSGEPRCKRRLASHAARRAGCAMAGLTVFWNCAADGLQPAGGVPAHRSVNHDLLAAAPAAVPDSAVSRYFHQLAVALVAPDATPDRVLAAAGAGRVVRERGFVSFDPPLAVLGRGSLQLDRTDPGRAPEAVDFYPGPYPRTAEDGVGAGRGEGALTLADLTSALGAWTRDPPGTSPSQADLIHFNVPGAEVARLGGGTTRIQFDATLSGDPTNPSVRVRQVGMRRDEFR